MQGYDWVMNRDGKDIVVEEWQLRWQLNEGSSRPGTVIHQMGFSNLKSAQISNDGKPR